MNIRERYEHLYQLERCYVNDAAAIGETLRKARAVDLELAFRAEMSLEDRRWRPFLGHHNNRLRQALATKAHERRQAIAVEDRVF